jgi:hypothetical protein
MADRHLDCHLAAYISSREKQDQQDLGRLIVRRFLMDRVTELLPFSAYTPPRPPQIPATRIYPFDPKIQVRKYAKTQERLATNGSGVLPYNTDAVLPRKANIL